MKKLPATGSILITILIMMPFFLLIATAYLQFAVSSFRVAHQDQLRTHAQFAADAGVDASMEQIVANEAWPGTVGETTLHDDGNVRTTYQTTVASPNADNKIITAIGRAYSPASATAPSSEISIKVPLRPIRAGQFSIVTGVGGLYLSNSAKVLGGDVFVNGELRMQNSAQIGLATSPVKLSVAHQNCPAGANPGPTYPRVCDPAENGEPINIQNSAQIYGEVHANNQTTTTGINPPTIASNSGVATQALPPHDREAQKTAINNADTSNSPDAMTGASASCTTNNGTKTWPANLKINGDVMISKDCKVTIEGDVWISGKFEMENSGQLIVSNGLTTTRANVMVDGQTTKFKNSSSIVSNSNGTGLQIISYWSNTACSPDCADVTGTDLYNSRDQVTIELDNSASGANTIFYSRWTKVLISNSGQIGALIGQTVELKNSGTITFGSSVGLGGATYWVIDGYQKAIN